MKYLPISFRFSSRVYPHVCAAGPLCAKYDSIITSDTGFAIFRLAVQSLVHSSVGRLVGRLVGRQLEVPKVSEETHSKWVTVVSAAGLGGRAPAFPAIGHQNSRHITRNSVQTRSAL